MDILTVGPSGHLNSRVQGIDTQLYVFVSSVFAPSPSPKQLCGQRDLDLFDTRVGCLVVLRVILSGLLGLILILGTIGKPLVST